MVFTPYAELVFIFCVIKEDKNFHNVPKYVLGVFSRSGNTLSLAIEGIEDVEGPPHFYSSHQLSLICIRAEKHTTK